MAGGSKTGFDRYFDERMKDSTFATEYVQARAQIDAIDSLIRALDQARENSGLSKAELARRIGAKPEIVRRLLTDTSGNPTFSTVLKVAAAVDYHLELVPNRNRGSVRRPAAAARSRRVR